MYVARGEASYNASGQIVPGADIGYAIMQILSRTGVGTGSIYEYSYILVDQRPSLWQPAKTADGKILNDKYLVNSSVVFNQV